MGISAAGPGPHQGAEVSGVRRDIFSQPDRHCGFPVLEVRPISFVRGTRTMKQPGGDPSRNDGLMELDPMPMATGLGDVAANWIESADRGIARSRAVLPMCGTTDATSSGTDLAPVPDKPIGWREAMPFLEKALKPLGSGEAATPAGSARSAFLRTRGTTPRPTPSSCTRSIGAIRSRFAAGTTPRASRHPST